MVILLILIVIIRYFRDFAKNMLIYSKITNFIAILWIIHMSHVAKQTDLDTTDQNTAYTDR